VSSVAMLEYDMASTIVARESSDKQTHLRALEIDYVDDIFLSK